MKITIVTLCLKHLDVCYTLWKRQMEQFLEEVLPVPMKKKKEETNTSNGIIVNPGCGLSNTNYNKPAQLPL